MENVYRTSAAACTSAHQIDENWYIPLYCGILWPANASEIHLVGISTSSKRSADPIRSISGQAVSGLLSCRANIQPTVSDTLPQQRCNSGADHVSSLLWVTKHKADPPSCFCTCCIHYQVAKDNDDRQRHCHSYRRLVAIWVGERRRILGKGHVDKHWPGKTCQEDHLDGCPNPFAFLLSWNCKILPTDSHGFRFQSLRLQCRASKGDLFLRVYCCIPSTFCLEYNQCRGRSYQTLGNAFGRKGLWSCRNLAVLCEINSQDLGQHQLVHTLKPLPSSRALWSCSTFISAVGLACRLKCHDVFREDLQDSVGMLCKIPANRNANYILSCITTHCWSMRYSSPKEYPKHFLACNCCKGILFDAFQ